MNLRGTGAGQSAQSARSHRSIRTRVVHETAFLVAVLGAAALCLSLVGRHSGLPLSQTPGNDLVLVQLYAAHFRHGDFIPVWASSDAYGMGSPVLLFYERLFFTVGGVIFIVLGGALKATMLVTLAIFMVFGAYGMRRALGVVTGDLLLQDVASVGYLFTNYVFTDWLVRGDLAEFSAMMTVPWLVHWCLVLVKECRMSWSIVPVTVLLVTAHNAVALIATALLFVTGIIFLVTYGLAGLRSVAVRLAIAVGSTTVILSPLLLAELKMARYYNPATKVRDYTGRISLNYTDPFHYLYDDAFHWFAARNSFPVLVQLDFALSVPIAIAVVLWGWRFVRRQLGVTGEPRTSAQAVTEASMVGLAGQLATGPSTSTDPDRSPGVPRLNGPVLAVLAISMAVYFLLQLRSVHFVFDLIPITKVIAFPYRMLVMITPLAMVLVVALADRWLSWYRDRQTRRTGWTPLSRTVPVVVAALWLVSLVALSPISNLHLAARQSLPGSPYYPIWALTVPKVLNDRTDPAPPLFQEYLPEVRGRGGGLLYTDARLYAGLHKHHLEGQSLSSTPCTVVQRPTAVESLAVHYTVSCAGPTEVALPISFNPFTTIDQLRANGGEREVPILHVPSDPRIVVAVAGPGRAELTAHLPTLWGILF
ncbi:MAG: hypothetical protein ACYDES_03285 [Acidimicrobiales bacterium]